MKDVRVSVCEKGRILGATFKGWMDGEEERERENGRGRETKIPSGRMGGRRLESV